MFNTPAVCPYGVLVFYIILPINGDNFMRRVKCLGTILDRVIVLCKVRTEFLYAI